MRKSALRSSFPLLRDSHGGLGESPKTGNFSMLKGALLLLLLMALQAAPLFAADVTGTAFDVALTLALN